MSKGPAVPATLKRPPPAELAATRPGLYTQLALEKLALRRSIVQLKIARARLQMGHHSRELAQPLALADAAVRNWQRIAPFLRIAALPAGMLLRSRPEGKIAKFLRWAPAISRVVRAVKCSLDSPRIDPDSVDQSRGSYLEKELRRVAP